MKIVSSPAMVPMTSGQRALSSALATLWAVQHGQRGSRGAVTLDERADGLEVARREHVLDNRQQVTVAALDHAELAQVAADAGLGRVVALAVEQGDQLGLTRDSVLPQDADDRIATLDLGVEIGGHGRCVRSG